MKKEDLKALAPNLFVSQVNQNFNLEVVEILVQAFSDDYKGSAKDFLRDASKILADDIARKLGEDVLTEWRNVSEKYNKLYNSIVLDYLNAVVVSILTSESVLTQDGELNAVASDILNSFTKYPYTITSHATTGKEMIEKRLKWWADHKEEEELKAILSENLFVEEVAKMWLTKEGVKPQDGGTYKTSDMLKAVKAVRGMLK